MTFRQRISLALVTLTTVALMGTNACMNHTLAPGGAPPADPVQVEPAMTPAAPPAAPAAEPDAGAADDSAPAEPDTSTPEVGFHKPAWDKHFVLQLTLRGPIDPDAAKAVGQVVDAVKAAEHDPKQDAIEAVVLVLDTTGGRVDSGQLIINSLQELDVPLVCVIDGDGISMGYLMLQDVCQVRLMTDHSDLMIHEIRMGGAVEIPGTRGEAKSFEEMMRVMNEGWMTMAAKRMGLTLDQLMAHIRNSAWWMSPEEALANHAVDAVVHNIHSQVIKPLEDGLQLPADLPQVRPAVQLPAPKPLSHAHKKPAGQPSRSSHR